MGHDQHNHNDTSNIRTAFFLNLLFTVVEIIGGLLTNSLAVLSDAVHDLGDSISLGIAWYFQKLSNKGRDHKYTFGYKRYSLLGAIINSIILVVGGIYIISEAIPRLIEPEVSHAPGMMALAVLGIVVNGAAALRLKKGHTQNEKVVALHMIEDVLGWVAVLIGSIVIYFTGWYIIDPILSFGIAFYILFNVFKNIKSSFQIILQRIPDAFSEEQIKSEIVKVNGVLDIHDLHLWSIDGEKNILSVHLVVEEELNSAQVFSVKNDVKKAMLDIGIEHCTLEVESISMPCIPHSD